MKKNLKIGPKTHFVPIFFSFLFFGGFWGFSWGTIFTRQALSAARSSRAGPHGNRAWNNVDAGRGIPAAQSLHVYTHALRSTGCKLERSRCSLF
eukprot:4624013-Amphidinium_carterae.1